VFRSTSTLADPNSNLNNNPNLNPKPNPFVVIYPHGSKMKGYGSCALFITISDFRGPPK